MIYLNSIVAGAFITLGFATSIMVTDATNKVFGSLYFCFGLFAVIWFSGHLFTSEIFKRYKKKGFFVGISKVWFGNLIGSLITGYAIVNVVHLPTELVAKYAHLKMDQAMLPMFISAIFANIFVCLATWTYIKSKNVVGVFLIISAFVILGFQHSIANMGLFTLAQATDFKLMVINIVIATLGNLVGGLMVAKYAELRGEYPEIH